MTGMKQSDVTKGLMSASHTGLSHTEETKALATTQGKSHASKAISVLNLEGKLVQSFSSQTAAAE